MLSSRYRDYYGSPSLGNALALLGAILEFDTADYWDFSRDISGISHPRCPAGPLLHTSGTSGEITSYAFAPHMQFWLREVEQAIKNPQRRKVVYINTMFGFHPGTTRLFDTKHHLYEYCVNGNWYKNPEPLIDGLSTMGPILVLADPKVFLYLSGIEPFLESAAKHDWKLASTGSEPFFPRSPFRNRSIHLNDHLIDWKNGFNFFECWAGTRHFLPTFAETNNGVVNLINLAGVPDDPDDFWEVGKRHFRCSCGKNALPLRFIPHRSVSMRNRKGWIYEPTFAERLTGRYQNFQMIQEGELLKILHVGAMQDEAAVRDFANRHEFSVEFIPDRLLLTSGLEKMSAFYNNHQGRQTLGFSELWRDRPRKLL